MKIVKLRIEDLTPDENNAKLHPKAQIKQIKASIKKFGNNDPIGVWGPKNIIVEGHGRYEALKDLGYKVVECIRLDNLTDEERRAYAVVHNKTTMNSGWDYGMLDDTLASIGNIDMSDFGIAQDGISYIYSITGDEVFRDSEREKTEIQITFTISTAYKEDYDKYMSTHTRRDLSDLIERIVKGGEE